MRRSRNRHQMDAVRCTDRNPRHSRVRLGEADAQPINTPQWLGATVSLSRRSQVDAVFSPGSRYIAYHAAPPPLAGLSTSRNASGSSIVGPTGL